MTDHSQNLKDVLEVCQKLGNDIQRAQSELNTKREMFLKYSGIAEYLSATEKGSDVDVSELARDDESSGEEAPEPVS